MNVLLLFDFTFLGSASISHPFAHGNWKQAGLVMGLRGTLKYASKRINGKNDG